MVRKLLVNTALALLGLAWVVQPVVAHGAQTDVHGHTLPIVAFLLSVTVLGGGLVADHFEVVDRSLADVVVVGGGVGIVLSVGLLWL
jgi:hypothetical protein